MFSPTSSTPLRILLETDAPYMVPANLYTALTDPGMKGKKLPICHSAMVPWTADFVAALLANEEWDADKVLSVARDNARKVYGV